MLAFLDTNIIIYLVEGAAPFRHRARLHLQSLGQQGFRFVVSDFLRSECLVGPMLSANAALFREYCELFGAGDFTFAPITAAVFERAAWIRATTFYHSSGTPAKRLEFYDAIHIATAVEARCARFVTNDQQLKSIAQIAVDILP